ncbi:hypothetical protein Desaci_2334 [Desulfosporosinus acidiphilus SJ4]|uniref:Uncharacterized protein n=1 Tax=Desulfosporosinus acidiphilus (strain DSM 22704 / JCM 16185 / SJ4) TaxID=646529 RepID=I4D663_DESAJ|nr:hypothetical protein [Desulfosporosinus acidiphilus]AFM41287.1 hypothetical protein Desaci_2334 [Desulfosporosinus acidiphilus SJ4]
MTSLTRNNYISQTEKLKRDTGDKSYPIWLLVNPKYPAVRHQIWTPVLAEIQDKVFREIQTRIDTTNIYIRNAVTDSGIVPNTLNWWGIEVGEEIEAFREIVLEYKPKVIITFGAFPYEFLRRVFRIKPEKGPVYWGNAILGEEFGKAIKNFDINKINRIPLLHRVNASGKFIENQNYFGESYFQYVGTRIAEKIIENKNELNIWIK